jgi:hypothetical protein
MKRMKKYIKDGKVAVLYSPDYGAGWYSWNSNNEELLFDKEIVEAVLADNRELAAEIAKKKYDAYTGGAKNLQIEWIDEGTQFEVEEYDGYESIHIIGSRDYITA